MKKYLLCLMLLFIGICLFADGADNYVPANFSKEQMDALANQFKAATGFVGTIKYDLDKGTLVVLKGDFRT